MPDMPEPPEPPRHLSVPSRRLWRSLMREYELEAHEVETLRLALEALDRARTARNALKRLGTTYEDRFGAPHVRPEVKVERDSTAAWLSLMGALKLPAEELPAKRSRTLRGTFDAEASRPRLRQVS